MACISRRPNCGAPDAPVVPEPLPAIGAAVGSIVGVIGVIGTILGIAGKLSVSGGVLTVAGVGIGGAAAVGTLGGGLGALAVVITVGVFALDRCTSGKGLRECVSGVVAEVVDSFASSWDEVFPFSAMHDRVDLVVKSGYWNVVESGSAFVHCTDQEPPRRSEVLRCYHYDPRVCGAADGAVIGAGVGGVAGIIAAALVAAAIGCATVILCVLAIIVAVLVAAAAALIGAFVGGQIGKAASSDVDPTAAGGQVLAVGDYVSERGNILRRQYDNGANVLWWVTTTSFHGHVRSGLVEPFSYCELDEDLPMDACPVAPPVIG